MRKQRKDVDFEELASDYALFGELLGEDAKTTKNKIQQKRKELRLEKGVPDDKANLEPLVPSPELPSYADFDRLLKDGVPRGSPYAKPEGETKALQGAKAPNRVSGSLPPADTDWRREEADRIREQGTQVLLQKATSANAGMAASKPAPVRPSREATPPRVGPSGPTVATPASRDAVATPPSYAAFASLLQREAEAEKGASRPELPSAPSKAKPTLAAPPRGSDVDTRWRGEEAERVKQRMEAMGLGPGGVAALAGVPKPAIGAEAKAPAAAPVRPAAVEPAKASAASSPAPAAAAPADKADKRKGAKEDIKPSPQVPQAQAKQASAEPATPLAVAAPAPTAPSSASSAAPAPLPPSASETRQKLEAPKPAAPKPSPPERAATPPQVASKPAPEASPLSQAPEIPRPQASASTPATAPATTSSPAPEAKGQPAEQGKARGAVAGSHVAADAATSTSARGQDDAVTQPVSAVAASSGGEDEAASEEDTKGRALGSLNRPKRTVPPPEEAAPATPAAQPRPQPRSLGGWSSGPLGVEHAVAGIAHTEDNAQLDAEWHKMELLKVTNETALASVVGSNNGGLLVRIGSLPGFVPASQLHPRRTAVLKKAAIDAKAANAATDGADKDAAATAARAAAMARERADLLAGLVGQALVLRVIVVERSAGRLILSERAVGDVSQPLKEQVMAQLNVGDVVKARVISFTAFGAFVEVRGVDALIHVSEIAWVRPVHPRDVVRIGEEIDAKVIRLDMEQRRIFLSRRQTLPDPLLQTLDSLVAAGDGSEGGASARARRSDSVAEADQVLAGLSDVIQKLREEEGVQSVSVGRVVVGTAFAPALQLFLSSEEEPGSYKVLGRRGRDIQEVSIKTSLSRDELRALLQSVSDATIATSSISE